jgi:glycosyltransferase involved in cell wall biosynthesis
VASAQRVWAVTQSVGVSLLPTSSWDFIQCHPWVAEPGSLEFPTHSAWAHKRCAPSVRREVMDTLQAQNEARPLVSDALLRPVWSDTDPRRILMILPWLSIGGADKFNLDLVEQLTRRGSETTICTTRESHNPWLPHFAALTSDILIREESPDLRDYPQFLGEIVESRQIEVVLISNSTLGYQLLPYLRSRYPAVTFVDYNHIWEEYWRDGGHPRSAIAYQDLLDLSIVSNEDLKKRMVSEGADAGRIEVCYTNVDTDRWDPSKYSRSEIRRALAVPEKEPLILFAGRISAQKRPRLLATILHELARRKLRFRCVVAGAGPEQRFLQLFILRHGLRGCVRLVGEVSNERIRELMAAADIFLLPSYWEGIALTLFEAMAMEVVPVSADVGGQRELVTAGCGFLVQRGDNELQEYTSVLEHLIGSPQLRTPMGAAGRQRILEHFTIDRMGDRMVELLETARNLATTRPRPEPSKGAGLQSAVLSAMEAPSTSGMRQSRFWRLGHRAADTLPGWIAYQAVLWLASKLGLREDETAVMAR